MNAKAMLAMLAVGALGLASAAKIVAYPYDGATLLAGQKFDLRIEVSGIEGSLASYSVTLNGKPMTGLVQSSQGAGQVEWTLRNTQLPGGAHTLAVQVTDAKGLSQRNFAWAGRANPALPQGAKKVIVFVGDGLGWNTINAARIIAKGYNTETGVANGYLEMMSGFGGSATVVNSSLDSFITDSANSAAGIFSGQKMQVNALNVYPDNTADTLDNPRIETLGEVLKRVRGAGVGIVSNTFGTDATPASLVAHTRRRGDYQAIADQYFKGAAQPDVMLLGGSRDFIPKSAAASPRGASLMAGITARSLSLKHSGEVQLTFPDLQLAWGQNWALLGPSGSGKTTLLHMLSGLLRPTSGQLLVDGQDLGQLSENQLNHYRRSQVSYLFQDFHLLEGYTALENVVLALGLAGQRGGSAYRRASEVLAEAGLAHRLHHTPRQLSTGERQRVALARAVVNQPRLILADEPTAHLDQERGQVSLQMLMDAASRLGALLVVATHDPLVTQHFDRRIELMRGGAG